MKIYKEKLYLAIFLSAIISLLLTLVTYFAELEKQTLSNEELFSGLILTFFVIFFVGSITLYILTRSMSI